MENLEIYNQLKEVPEEAKKEITGGRLAGMTDIKPMWRIEKLTEVFGPVGLGWYTETLKKEIIDGANDEKVAIVDILLYVNYKTPFKLEEDLWSKGIEGTGGSSFVAKEKSGLYVSDECFKMATTDALSVACKSLGMGANVYWGDSKYNTTELTKETAEEYAKNYIFKKGKHADMSLKEIIDNKDTGFIEWLLDNSKDQQLKQAIELLTGVVMPSEEEQEERLKLMAQISKLSIEKHVLPEEIHEKFNVEDTADLSLEQMRKCVSELEKKEVE